MKVKEIFALLLVFTLVLQPTLLIPLKVLGTPEDFSVVNVNVWSSADTAYVYPGSKRVNFKVEVLYQHATSAYSVVGWLTTASGISFSYGSGSVSPARLLNGSVATKVNLGDYVTFEYLLDIPGSLIPETYTLQLNITYVKGGIFTYEVHPLTLRVAPYPSISLRFVDAYFSPASYPGSVDTRLYVILENTGNNSITSANFNITLPEKFTIRNPRANIGLVNKGERFTLTFSEISIPLDAEIKAYNTTIYADVSAQTEDGVAYNTTVSLSFPVKVESPPPEEPIMLASVNTLYNGAWAPLLPSAEGVVLRVYLVNRLPDAISSMALNVTLPSGIHVKTVSGTYVNGMAAGGSCFVDLTLAIDSKIIAGRYKGELNITYLRIVSGTSFLMNQNLSFPINVESFHGYTSELALVTAYWGYPDPSPAYSNSRYVPLTIRLVNEGRYAAWGVVVNASSPHLLPIKNSEASATSVASGSYCTTVLYFDIKTDSPNIPVKVYVKYFFTEFGTHKLVIRNFTTPLPLESYPASESILSVVSAGWQNNVNVFPRTSNATYQITLANRAPFSVSGVKLSIKLPDGMSSKGQSKATAYFEGPIRSLATFTTTFTVSVGDIPPRNYNATLTADCILLSGGPGVRRVENFTAQISVADDASALELVDSRWYEGSVGPNTYNAHLIILVRNVYVDGLRGAVLSLQLPDGMYNAADNSSNVKATPLSVQLSQPLQTQNLAEMLSAFLNMQQASPAQVYSRGDILTFMVSLNLFDVNVGNYKVYGRISYIDPWGSNREIPLTIPVAILGRTSYIEISLDENLSVRSRHVKTYLTIANRGSSPLYDAYLVVSPYQGAPILIASPAVNHIEKINPGESCQVPLTLAYNPLGFYSQTGTVSVTYGPVPLMVSIVYRDASGYPRTFNNSITVVVEPFIELLIRNVRATGTNSSSTVTGIIVNYGSSTARCVEAELKIGDMAQSSFIGDIEPGSEVAFRVDADKYNGTALLILKYYNVFNEQETKEMSVSITLQEEAAPPQSQVEEWPIERWIIVVGVFIFLVTSAVIIYKTLRKSKLTEKI